MLCFFFFFQAEDGIRDIGVTGVQTCALPITAGGPPPWLTVAVLVSISALNVEISRALTGGLERSQQPHKALSAWAFACAMLLAPPWLLVVVPITYVHARWRGLRVPLWKGVGSAAFLVLAGLASTVVAHVALGGRTGWMTDNGARGARSEER